MKHATVYRLSRKIWSARANWLKLESIVKSIRPDIIHIHSLGGFDAWMIFKFAQKERIPIVISPYKELMDWNFHNKYLRRKLSLLWFFQHDMLKEAAATAFISAARIRSHVIPAGILRMQPARICARGRCTELSCMRRRTTGKTAVFPQALCCSMPDNTGWPLPADGMTRSYGLESLSRRICMSGQKRRNRRYLRRTRRSTR